MNTEVSARNADQGANNEGRQGSPFMTQAQKGRISGMSGGNNESPNR